MENYLNSEEAKYERAKKRVRALSGFYKHLAVYIIVNAALIAIKYFNGENSNDFIQFNTFSTAFFWGIGLAFHAMGVFYNHVFFGRSWEDRKIRELMDKDKDKQQKWE
jgi:hypothetical protein